MKRSIFFFTALCLGFVIWLLQQSTDPDAGNSLTKKTVRASTIQENPSRQSPETKPRPVAQKKLQKPAPKLQQIGAREITEDDIASFLIRHKYSAEALAFAAALYNPPDPELIKRALEKDPDSKAAKAMEIKIIRNEAMGAYYEQRKGESETLHMKAHLATLINADPKNGHYHTMKLLAAMDIFEHSAVPGIISAIGKCDPASGNLAALSRGFFDGFLATELGLSPNEAARIVRDDKFTGPGVGDVLRAVKDFFLGNPHPMEESAAVEALSGAITFVHKHRLDGDDIYAYVSALEAEAELLDRLNGLRGGALVRQSFPQSFESFEAYAEDLQEKMNEAHALRDLLKNPADQIPESYLKDRAKGEIQALRNWMNARGTGDQR